jgi:hypothetical protein
MPRQRLAHQRFSPSKMIPFGCVGCVSWSIVVSFELGTGIFLQGLEPGTGFVQLLVDVLGFRTTVGLITAGRTLFGRNRNESRSPKTCGNAGKILRIVFPNLLRRDLLFDAWVHF